MRHKQKPVILSNVLVENYAAEGKCISRVEGKAVFIENVVPGDVVDVQLYKNKKDWAEGFPLHFKKYSTERVQPFCRHFGVCGGCQWQHLPYEKQLQYKQQQVVDNLTRIGKIQLPQIQSIAGCQHTIRYRNKLEYTFSNKRYIPDEEFKQLSREEAASAHYKDVAGYHAKGVFDKVVEIDICHLQEEPTNALRKTIAQYAKDNQLPFYDIKGHHGWLRTMQVRTTTTGELMVNVVVGYEDNQHQQALQTLLLQQFPQITTLLFTINTKKNDSLYDLEPQVVHGKGFITEKLEDYYFKISPKSFFQTNSLQGEVLYAITRQFAELDGTQTVYDLYCGTGSIGIFVSALAKKIIGVEMVEEAIADARENAALNNINHAQFFTGDVVTICNDDFFAEHGRPDVIITDPPRAGMHEKLVNKLLDIAAPLVVYVSCNPATQARDLALLDAKYAVTRVQPVDMFPHTLHIENVVQLKLR
ncbi:23S rRNA (uracil(1939)-C(5))-methyltransferase RlmD [Ilyomonas limi]|uniref:23S rRNA (Uracil(1939)-C(5))-methyltransferase RlmD n=1 Tax=Ilyomonas limi TaxID=2575867 RepID=A0A4U3KYE5_9BACT|nr:23S rRNA (uracil(1939)-C(5))-methyltransferase RlmD [Ilyomonas limi]TKK67685.1 23S rRNA (uracil(1939)-C(5))-methyltransferase RlmD [Ilyomonas limi]